MSRPAPADDRDDRLAGVLLGTALGDALGLPAEGMSAAAIARRFGRVERFRLLGRTGFVSDDTEQAALVAQSLVRHPDDPSACVRDFERALLGWFARLPWGVGRATVRSCVRIALGRRPTGVMSAGNGAAMRAAVVGVALADRPAERLALGRALAEVTHRDPRAVEGALYVAELAAALARRPPGPGRFEAQAEARAVVTVPELGRAIDRARELAGAGRPDAEAAAALGTSGFVQHTVALATFVLLQSGDAPLDALARIIALGGDTDSNAAVLGAWLGAERGARGLPAEGLGRIHDGPFGPTHLRALAAGLAAHRRGEPAAAPAYSAAGAMARNVLLLPVILGHGLRRLLPG